jgi:hypothetical protein
MLVVLKLNFKILVFLLVLLLLFSGCAEEKPLQKEKKTVSADDEILDGQQSKDPKTLDEKYDFCLGKENVQLKDECLQSLAIEFNKDYFCEELTNLDQEKCKRLVWKAAVVLSQEIDNCNSLVTEFDKIQCLKEIALLSSDETICTKIPVLSEKNSCLTQLAIQEKDLSFCDLILGSTKDSCLFNAIIVISDPSLCDSFSLPTIKFSCISTIAKNNNDYSLCSKISDSILKRNCERNITP